MALDATDTGRGFNVCAKGNVEFTQRCIGTDRETAVPELSIKMLGVLTLDPLTAAEPEVDGPVPGTKESRKRTHVGGGCATASKARCQTRVTGFIYRPDVLNSVQFPGDRIEGFFPADGYEPGVLVATFFRVGPFHRGLDTMGIVSLLYQPIGLDADPAAARMNI